MPEGEVGGGHQNNWERHGTIYEKFPKESPIPHTFRKNNISTSTIDRNDSACWTAGTPVEWNRDPQKAKAITAEVAKTNMLVSRDPITRRITEYHPLITFFNEVMAQIMRDGHKELLDGLEDEENATALWRYLDEKYLTKPAPRKSVNGDGAAFKRTQVLSGKLLKKK